MLLLHFFLISLNIFPLIGYRDSMDEKSKANLVQIKGRFSVTSENLDLVKVRFYSHVMIVLFM